MQQKDSRELTPEEKWEQATLANNFIFYKVMRHHPAECKEMLELLLGIKVDRIEMHNEETIDVDFTSKGIRLDLYVSDSDRVFDIEIQATDTGELSQRARYYQGIMDVDTRNRNDVDVVSVSARFCLGQNSPTSTGFLSPRIHARINAATWRSPQSRTRNAVSR